MTPEMQYQWRIRFGDRPGSHSTWFFGKPTDREMEEWKEDFLQVRLERRSVTYGPIEEVEG